MVVHYAMGRGASPLPGKAPGAIIIWFIFLVIPASYRCRMPAQLTSYALASTLLLSHTNKAWGSAAL